MEDSDTESFHSAVDDLSDQEDGGINDTNLKREEVGKGKVSALLNDEYKVGFNEMQNKCSDKPRMLETLPANQKKQMFQNLSFLEQSSKISVQKKQISDWLTVNDAQFDPEKKIISHDSHKGFEMNDVSCGKAPDFQGLEWSTSQCDKMNTVKISRSINNDESEKSCRYKKLFEMNKFKGEKMQKFEIESGKISRIESEVSERGALSEFPDYLDSANIKEEIEFSEKDSNIDHDDWDDWELEYPGKDSSSKRIVNKKRELPLVLISGEENRIIANSESKAGLKAEVKSNKSFWDWGEFSDVVAAVGEGLTNISNVVESGLGFPAPEELARNQSVEKSANDFTVKNEEVPVSNIKSYGKLFAGFGANVVTGSLEVLEAIGKKTFEKLTIPEEGSEKRRFIFEPERGQNLSEILRELRKSRAEEVTLESSCIIKRELTFIDCFEKYGGMLHLEGLEMLSKNYLRKIAPQRRSELDEIFAEDLANTLEEYQENRQDNFPQDFKEILLAIALPYNGSDLMDCYDRCQGRLERLPDSSDRIFEVSLECLADFTSQSVHSIHKLGQLLLITAAAMNQEPFSELHSLMGRHISHLSYQFAQHISAVDTSSEKIEELVTALFLAAGDSFSYVQQSFRLLRPLLIL